ncbi:transmembrane protein 272-like isoform X2 [Ascaphus truei]|uniref:transmembrane protein 272-like isoform X2 n=1 Tax=Ascaphus truei TaxID=8439 RepID=UPI003F59EECB
MGLALSGGVSHHGDCLIQPLIPTYLTVGGSAHIVAIAVLPIKLLSHQLAGVLEGLLLLFSLCWLITGSVWVFPVYSITFPILCDRSLYNFALSILVFHYIYLAIFSIGVVVLICISGVKGLTKASLF